MAEQSTATEADCAIATPPSIPTRSAAKSGNRFNNDWYICTSRSRAPRARARYTDLRTVASGLLASAKIGHADRPRRVRYVMERVTDAHRDWLADQFEENRAHLRAVAYRMLGSSSDAEDAVQEAWLRLSRADSSGVQN